MILPSLLTLRLSPSPVISRHKPDKLGLFSASVSASSAAIQMPLRWLWWHYSGSLVLGGHRLDRVHKFTHLIKLTPRWTRRYWICLCVVWRSQRRRRREERSWMWKHPMKWEQKRDTCCTFYESNLTAFIPEGFRGFEIWSLHLKATLQAFVVICLFAVCQ